MEMLSPDATLGEVDSGDEVRFFRVGRFGGLDCLKATFRKHIFPPHTHESYGIGAFISGQHIYKHQGVLTLAGANDLCFINPEEVHDGTPHGEGYVYRIIYPKTALLIQLIEDVSGRPAAAPCFQGPIIHDPELSPQFVRAHEALELNTDPLGADEAMTVVLARMIERYADGNFVQDRGAREPEAVRRAKEYLAANFDGQVELSTLAIAAGLSPFHLIRVFRRATGLTPHAWLIDRRVHRASELLRQGKAPAGIAMSCGFADQSHLSRLFKSRLGVTPGQYKGSRAAA
jgi:AraC-like DNA-binding protein